MDPAVRYIVLMGGAPAYDRVLSELFDPSLSAGTTVKLVGPTSTLYVKSDGSKWVNVRNGQEYSPYWLPLGANLHVDFTGGHYYWGGAEKTLGDLTVVVAGGYSLAYGFSFAGESTVVLEYTPADKPAAIINTLFSWTTGYPAGNRVEFSRAYNPTYGDGINLYVSPGNPTADNQAVNTSSKIGEAGGVYHGQEMQRLVVRLKNSTNHRYKNDNGPIATGLKGAGALVVPTKIGFGCRAWANPTPDSQLTGATLNRVTLYNAAASDDVIHAMGRSSFYWPVHLLGDSFLNLYDTLQCLRKDLIDGGVYVSTSQDGVGGTTSTQQATRYTVDYPDWQDSTLVWCEMGLDGVWADWLTAANIITGAMKHDRWLVMEPAPNVDDGTAERVTWDAFVANIRSYCGGDYTAGGHFVPTLEAAMALSDGSAQDLAKVAARRWPTSLTVSDIDFHPNHTLGAPFFSGQMYAALAAKGWAA